MSESEVLLEDDDGEGYVASRDSIQPLIFTPHTASLMEKLDQKVMSKVRHSCIKH